MTTATAQIDIEQAARHLRERNEDRRHDLEQRIEQARKDFDAIVNMLIRKYDPVRIWQWGSLIDGKGFSEISDLDIGVEGEYSPEQYFNMLGDAMELSDFPVHLIDMKDIHPAYGEQVRRKGRVVYERQH